MNQRALLLIPKFYGIETKLTNSLERLGYEVIWIENKTFKFDYHATKSKLKLLRWIYFSLINPHKNYIRKQLNRLENIKIDLLFSINCFVICPYLFIRLRKRNPNLISILFLWDSFSKYLWKKESRLFDKVYSFDKEDSLNYHFEYIPNFFVKPEKVRNHTINHDLFYAGKFSTERLKILDKVLAHINKSENDLYIKVLIGFKNLVHSKSIYQFLKIIRIETPWITNYLTTYEINEGISKRDYITSEEIELDKLKEEFSGSNCILDLPYTGQSGYSHGLISALALGKKVITTNFRIIKENFYNPSQVMIIDHEDPHIESTWLRDRVTFETDRYFENLEISAWLKYILKVNHA
jgi:hypothetical protein